MKSPIATDYLKGSSGIDGRQASLFLLFKDEARAVLVDPFENVLSFSSSFWYKSLYFTNHFFPENHSLIFMISVFICSFYLARIDKYVYGNQQHCFIYKVRNQAVEVEKAVTNILASKFKENWLKNICSLLKGSVESL